MPIVFAHSARLRLRTATYFGVIDDNTLLRAYRSVANGYDASLDNIVDLTGVTSVLIGEAVLAELAQLFDPQRATAPLPRLAVITLTDIGDDVAQLLRCLYHDAEWYACRSLDEAHRRLERK